MKKIKIKHDEGSVFVGEDEVHFSPNQYEILRFLIEKNGKIASRQELMEVIYSDEKLTRDPHAIDTCISRIRSLLGRSRNHISTVTNRGYKWSPK